MFLFNRRSRNESDLIEILHTLVSVIKQHVVRAFLETFNTASILLGPHHTRVVSGSSWPKANDALFRVDGKVTWQHVKYYGEAVIFLQSDGVAVVVTDGHCGLGSTCNESAII